VRRNEGRSYSALEASASGRTRTQHMSATLLGRANIPLIILLVFSLLCYFQKKKLARSAHESTSDFPHILKVFRFRSTLIFLKKFKIQKS
jgi:hypothetical protein